MRLVILFGCGVTMLLSAACSSDPSKPVAEGTATLTFSGCTYVAPSINGPGGSPTADDFGDSVLNGSTGGFKVSCSVSNNGAFTLHGHIESPETSITVDSVDVSAGAQMSFYVSGATGTPEPVASIDTTTNKAAATCTLTTSGSGLYLIKPGAIFAHYECPAVASTANLSSSCRASGDFYFTNCGS